MPSAPTKEECSVQWGNWMTGMAPSKGNRGWGSTCLPSTRSSMSDDCPRIVSCGPLTPSRTMLFTTGKRTLPIVVKWKSSARWWGGTRMMRCRVLWSNECSRALPPGTSISRDDKFWARVRRGCTTSRKLRHRYRRRRAIISPDKRSTVYKNNTSGRWKWLDRNRKELTRLFNSRATLHSRLCLLL